MGNPTLPAPRGSYRQSESPFVFVSVADLRHSKGPRAVIATVGLGACLGITCYDPIHKIGGLLHTMLPDSHARRQIDLVPGMYLDLGLPLLVEAMIRAGADLGNLEYKVFGGAQILQSNEYFSIGRQNVDMMKQLAGRYRLNVQAWHVGGQHNRSIELHLRDGRVLLRVPSKPDTWI